MKLIQFFETVGILKTIERTGWVRFNIPDPESVADHSFRTAIMAMILAPKVGADINKSVKMALIHDIGEAKIGDLVIMRGKKYLPNALDKKLKEQEAFTQIMSGVGEEDYVKLFLEFEEKKTKEAILVKEIDKLEMAMQAYEHEKKHKINLGEFFDSARVSVDNKEIKEILQEIEKLRVL